MNSFYLPSDTPENLCQLKILGRSLEPRRPSRSHFEALMASSSQPNRWWPCGPLLIQQTPSPNAAPQSRRGLCFSTSQRLFFLRSSFRWSITRALTWLHPAIPAIIPPSSIVPAPPRLCASLSNIVRSKAASSCSMMGINNRLRAI